MRVTQTAPGDSRKGPRNRDAINTGRTQNDVGGQIFRVTKPKIVITTSWQNVLFRHWK